MILLFFIIIMGPSPGIPNALYLQRCALSETGDDPETRLLFVARHNHS